MREKADWTLLEVGLGGRHDATNVIDHPKLTIITKVDLDGEKVEDVVKKGEVITAKCLGVDEKGRVKMSRRAWLRDQAAAEAEKQQPVAAE